LAGEDKWLFRETICAISRFYDENNNPMFLSVNKEIELSFKETEAIAEGIIYYFKINSQTRSES